MISPWIKYGLAILMPIYSIAIWVRNLLYHYQLFKTHSTPIPSVLVGNLSVGGSGKTPCVEYLIDLLTTNGVSYMSVLSRGYKRKTKGFVEATSETTHRDIGDEAHQIYTKYPNVYVCVDADRNRGVHTISERREKTQVVLLDDGLQHRAIHTHLTIILTPYHRPFYRDHLMPVGTLREHRYGATRGDIIIITKCPATLSTSHQDAMREKVEHYAGEKDIYFSTLVYDQYIYNAKGERGEIDYSKKHLVVTGIADPTPMLDHLRERGIRFSSVQYSDHHNFTSADIASIRNKMDKEGCSYILTTEKDFVRLSNFISLLPSLLYIKIRMKLLNNEEAFRDRIMNIPLYTT